MSVRRVEEMLVARPTSDGDGVRLMRVFGGHVPAAPVRSVAQALEAGGPQQVASWPAEGGEPGLRLLRSPLRTSRPAPELAPAPALGADTASILATLGIDAAQLAVLRERGVV